MKPTRVMIIVVSTNDGRWLAPCLRSLAKTSREQCQVVVVANDCLDSTREVCERASLPITLLHTERRQGFAACNNIALSQAIERDVAYAFLLNPDTLVHAQAVQNSIDFLDSHPDYGIVGSLQFAYEDDLWVDWNAWSRETVAHASELGKYPVEGDCHTWLDHYYVQGAAMMLRLSLVPRIGMLDPVYGTFYEETDLCRRCLLAGLKVAILFDSKVRHFGGGNWRVDENRRRERDLLFLRNQFVYYLSAEQSAASVTRTAWRLLCRQYRAMRHGCEDVTLPWWRYPQVIADFARNIPQVFQLAWRNRLIRSGQPLPRRLWSIGRP